MDFEKDLGIQKIDDYEQVNLDIIGWKSVKTKKGEEEQVVECKTATNQIIGLFSKQCQVREGKLWVLKRHMAYALQNARQ